MQVWSLGREDPLKVSKATHSSILAWRILWTAEPVGLGSIGLQKVRHDWSNLAWSAQNTILWTECFHSKFLCWNLTPNVMVLGGGASFIRVQIPFVRVPLSWANHLPKAPPLKSIKLGARILRYEFWRDRNILDYSTAWDHYFMFQKGT